MGLTNERDELEMYDGTLRIMDADGKLVADALNPHDYEDVHHGAGRTLVVSEVTLLQAARLSGGDLSGRPIGAPAIW